MLRMRRITDQGFVVLAALIEEGPDTLLTSRSIAERTGLPQATTAKVLKVLQRSGLLSSTRGLCGGYSLDCDPSQTSILTVIEAFEGPVGLTECSLPGAITCDDHDTCQLGHAWPVVTDAVTDALRSVTLLDLVAEHSPATRAPASAPVAGAAARG